MNLWKMHVHDNYLYKEEKAWLSKILEEIANMRNCLTNLN